MASGTMKRAPAALFLIALAGLAPSLAHAQSTSSAESTLWGSMLKGLGVGGDNNIEYRERPPLVVPQTRDLPPPGSARANANPNWPTDPKSANAAVTKGSQVHDLDKIPVEVGAKPVMDTPANQPEQSNSLFGKLFSKGSENVTPPTPTRRSLTEPPLDYQAPSPSQPYGESTKSAPEKPATGEGALASTPGTAPGANPSVGTPGR